MRAAVTLIGTMLAIGLSGAPSSGQAAAQAQDADRKVAGGGITVPGWTGKADAGNKQGLTITDGKLAPEGDGFRLTTGPAALYWNPANVAKGEYSVKATFTEPRQSFSHPHPYGYSLAAPISTAVRRMRSTAGRTGTAPSSSACSAAASAWTS
jgi:hypothetical protein